MKRITLLGLIISLLIFQGCDNLPSDIVNSGTTIITFELQTQKNPNNETINKLKDVLGKRIERFQLSTPTISGGKNPKQFTIELHGIKDTTRIKKLLCTKGKLEFWTTYENEEIYNSLFSANQLISDCLPLIPIIHVDSTKILSEAELQEIAKDTNLTLAEKIDLLPSQPTVNNHELEYPLFKLLQPAISPEGSTYPGANIGWAHYNDTTKVNELMNIKNVRKLFPRNMIIRWSEKPLDESPEFLQLYALKAERWQKPSLSGDIITKTKVENRGNDNIVINFQMNEEAAKIWSFLTSENVGKYIAIVIDNRVYSCPFVSSQILNGSSVITGDFELEEANDLCNILNSGSLPVEIKIIEIEEI